MNYDLITLGCKVNEYESTFYQEQLKEIGFAPGEPADLCLINTCTVTNKAAAKSRQMISRLKKKHPRAKIAVIGCYATMMDDSQAQSLGIDKLIRSKSSLKEEVNSLFFPKTGKPESKEERPESKNPEFEAMPVHAFGQHRAFLKVQDGCNQFCAYCQIPYARGRERSWSAKDAVETAVQLAKNGHREIVLTGIHTGRYQSGDTDLAALLKQMLEATPSEVSYRISSIEITEVSDDLISLMKENPRILPHLHIPIQAGSDDTLKRMRRPYSVDEFAERLEKIRQEIPEISISSDIIAGFVQESEEEFEQTLHNLEKLGFSFLHVFGYSRRQGTLADKMDGHLDGNLIRGRVAALMQLSSSLRQKDMERFETGEVLLEEYKQGYYSGYTRQYHPVRIYTPEKLEGRVRVRLHPDPHGYYVAQEKDILEVIK